MPTLEENVNRVKAAKTAIGNAITAKGGTVGANDGLEDFASDIASIPSGGGGSSSNAVKFYDYDGTIVQSYSASDFANLSELPANPTHEGLTAQGWNWSLSDAKTYVAANDKLDIGQMYITSDDKTRLYITLLDDYKSPTLEFYLNANSEVDVDWGDGSSHSTLSSTSAGYQSETHSYGVSGNYIIAITVVSGSIEIYGNSNSFSLLKGNDSTTNTNYRESLFNIEIGSSVTSIGTYAFYNCTSLTSITIPSSVTSIGTYAFYNCTSLTSITMPSSVTSIGTYAFYNCTSLTSITIPSSVTSIGTYAFSNCYTLNSITIPLGVTSIGTNAFYNCTSLTSITMPSSVTSIGTNAFSNCYALTSIIIPLGVTSIGIYAFSNCYTLTSITIPSSVTSIGTYAFSNCYALTTITIPSGVTSIANNTFDNCASLTSITIPSSVTSIANSTFNNCYALKYIYLLGISISGAPWGAPNTHTKVITLSRYNNYSDAENETQSGTELTTTINCNTDDLIVAAFIVRSSYTIPSDWNILTISDDIETSSGTHQWTGVLYKVATGTTETITISQSNAGRIYTNLIAIPSASIGTYSVFSQESPDTSITINKPIGLNVIVCSCILGSPDWSCDDDTTVLTSSTKRLGVLLDQTKEGKNTTISGVSQNAGLIATYITITGIDNFWYYVNP